MKKGDRVVGPHGSGVIVEVRKGKDMPDEKVNKVMQYINGAPTSVAGKIGSMLLDVVYGPERYPYRVQYDCGYNDVYSENSIKPEQHEMQCSGKYCQTGMIP